MTRFLKRKKSQPFSYLNSRIFFCIGQPGLMKSPFYSYWSLGLWKTKLHFFYSFISNFNLPTAKYWYTKKHQTDHFQFVKVLHRMTVKWCSFKTICWNTQSWVDQILHIKATENIILQKKRCDNGWSSLHYDNYKNSQCFIYS